MTLPHQTTLRAQIAERLDIETAEAEWRRTGHLRLEAFAEPLVDMLAQWCAPVRDPDVARLRDISDPIEFFRSVSYQFVSNLECLLSAVDGDHSASHLAPLIS